MGPPPRQVAAHAPYMATSRSYDYPARGHRTPQERERDPPSRAAQPSISSPSTARASCYPRATHVHADRQSCPTHNGDCCIGIRRPVASCIAASSSRSYTRTLLLAGGSSRPFCAHAGRPNVPTVLPSCHLRALTTDCRLGPHAAAIPIGYRSEACVCEPPTAVPSCPARPAGRVPRSSSRQQAPPCTHTRARTAPATTTPVTPRAFL